MESAEGGKSVVSVRGGSEGGVMCRVWSLDE